MTTNIVNLNVAAYTPKVGDLLVVDIPRGLLDDGLGDEGPEGWLKELRAVIPPGVKIFVTSGGIKLDLFRPVGREA